jgi:hypothetical protein
LLKYNEGAVSQPRNTFSSSRHPAVSEQD